MSSRITSNAFSHVTAMISFQWSTTHHAVAQLALPFVRATFTNVPIASSIAM